MNSCTHQATFNTDENTVIKPDKMNFYRCYVESKMKVQFFNYAEKWKQMINYSRHECVFM